MKLLTNFDSSVVGLLLFWMERSMELGTDEADDAGEWYENGMTFVFPSQVFLIFF